MRYLDFKEQFKDFLVFSLDDIRKANPSFHRQRLNEWQDRGYIKKIIREQYIFSDLEIDEAVLFVIANSILHPSYISLEMALSYYGLIPEGVYTVTSVTSRKTQTFNASVASFSYRKIKPALVFGYQLSSCRNHHFKIAEVEKAILDYLYFNHHINSAEAVNGLRLNKESLATTVDFEKLNSYAQRFQNRALQKRVDVFTKFTTENA